MLVPVLILIVILLLLLIKVVQNTNKRKHSFTGKDSKSDVSYVAYSGSFNDNTVASDIGKNGEREVSFVLRSLPQEYLVANNVVIPDQVTDPNKKYTTQIDHIVISPFGVFVIETKNYKGWIFGSEKSREWKEVFRTTPEHYFYNPIKQNWGHVYALAEHLRLNTEVFIPVVVFLDNCKLNVETRTPVVYVSQLEGFILNHTKEIISRRNVTKIYERLNKIILAGGEIENKHIQSIGERRSEKETALREGRCPRCGCKMIQRNGKYGPFFACSNYPRCRFTHSVH